MFNALFLFIATAAWQQTAEDVLIALAIGVAALFLLVIIFVLMVALALVGKWGFTQFTKADAALAGFGQSETGRYAYNRLQGLASQYDQPTDSGVIQVTSFLNTVLENLPDLFKLALPWKDDALTPEDVTQASAIVFGGLAELLNGLPTTAKTPEELLKGLQTSQLRAKAALAKETKSSIPPIARE